MKLGTVVYNNQIYNLDYMSIEEMRELLNKIKKKKKSGISDAKNIIKDNN